MVITEDSDSSNLGSNPGGTWAARSWLPHTVTMLLDLLCATDKHYENTHARAAFPPSLDTARAGRRARARTHDARCRPAPAATRAARMGHRPGGGAGGARTRLVPVARPRNGGADWVASGARSSTSAGWRHRPRWNSTHWYGPGLDCDLGFQTARRTAFPVLVGPRGAALARCLAEPSNRTVKHGRMRRNIK